MGGIKAQKLLVGALVTQQGRGKIGLHHLPLNRCMGLCACRGLPELFQRLVHALAQPPRCRPLCQGAMREDPATGLGGQQIAELKNV